MVVALNIRKLKTNSLLLQNYLDKMEKSISPSLEIQNNDKIKMLGIEWDTINDYLIYFMRIQLKVLKVLFRQKAIF